MGDSRRALFEEIDPRDFHFTPSESKIVINDFEDFLNRNSNLSFDQKRDFFVANIPSEHRTSMAEMFNELFAFIHTEPRLPDNKKKYVSIAHLQISTEQTREEIIEHISSMRDSNEYAALTQYTYRDMSAVSWIPFVKSALERNPVCVEALREKSAEEAYSIITAMPEKSIYSAGRLAQPDEVWNFGVGNGIEKAFVMMNVLKSRKKDSSFHLEINNERAVVTYDRIDYVFSCCSEYAIKITVKGEIIEENTGV